MYSRNRFRRDVIHILFFSETEQTFALGLRYKTFYLYIFSEITNTQFSFFAEKNLLLMGKERAAAVIHFLRERVSMLTLIYLRTCLPKSKLHHWQIFCGKRYKFLLILKVLVDIDGRNGRGARSSMHCK